MTRFYLVLKLGDELKNVRVRTNSKNSDQFSGKVRLAKTYTFIISALLIQFQLTVDSVLCAPDTKYMAASHQPWVTFE